MTLEEMEYQSARIAEAGYPLHDQEAVNLARMLLRVLPVVRAAEEWRDAKPGSPKWSAKAWRMRDAVDQMRREMEE